MKRPQIKIEGDKKRDGWVYNRTSTSVEWTAYLYPLELGEIGYDSDTNTAKIGDGVSLWAALPSLSGGGGGGTPTFETVSRNLDARGATIVYGVEGISTITYIGGIIKTFSYGVDGLSTIILSGSTPGGIDLTKTLIYTLGEFTGWTYS